MVILEPRPASFPLLLAAGLLAGLLGSTGCRDIEIQACSDEIRVNDECPAPELRCPFPLSKCGIICTCRYSPGMYRWDCPSSNCSCLCPCDRLLISSCEALECSKPEDPCPANMTGKLGCEIVCADAGPPDAGLSDAGPPDAGLPDVAPADACPADSSPGDFKPADAATDAPCSPVDAYSPDGGGAGAGAAVPGTKLRRGRS